MYVLGTAGHVDHGKSSFLRALTGMEPDRLPEERRRGMTLDLNFLHFKSATFGKVGIVDVPGHESLIKNFTTGVSAMDAFIFVVAADDGWMPQSTEHLNILRVLNVKNGICILSKTDQVDASILKLRLIELKEIFLNSFGKQIQVLPFSIHEPNALAPIKRALEELLSQLSLTHLRGPEIWIDRVFTPKGMGKVVTGTLRGGKIQKGSLLYLNHKNTLVDIKGIQSFGESVDSITGNTRVALQVSTSGNLSIERGMLLSAEEDIFQCSIFDAKVSFFGKALKRNTRVALHIGTLKVGALAIPLDSECHFYRFKTETPIPVKVSGLILLRTANEQHTLGGARVLEVKPKGTHKKLGALYRTGIESLENYVSHKQNTYPVLDIQELIRQSYWKEREIRPILSKQIELSTNRFIQKTQEEWFLNQLEGRTELNKIRMTLKKDLLPTDIDSLYSFWLKNQRIKSTLMFNWDEKSTRDLSAIKELWTRAEGKPFDAKSLGVGAIGTLKQLCTEKLLVALNEGFYVDFKSLENYRILIEDHLKLKGSATTIEMKELLKLSRRPTVLILERLDADRITYLKGNVRRALKAPSLL